MRNKYHFYGMALRFTEKIDTKVTEDTLKEIKHLSEFEMRSFAGTMRMLLHEALEARKTLKWVSKADNEQIIDSKTKYENL